LVGENNILGANIRKRNSNEDESVKAERIWRSVENNGFEEIICMQRTGQYGEEKRE